MSALQQFVGARIDKIVMIDEEGFHLELTLPDGSDRSLDVYHVYHHPLAVRVDGMFVHPEEL